MDEFDKDNAEACKALMFVENTDNNIFLTGNAGTGKTTFLKYIKEHSNKRLIITAPTGVAAINAGGVTLHSFFQLSLGPLVPEAIRENDYTHKFNNIKINIMRSLDLLVIDEISMVRADTLDAIDCVLRRFRDNQQPFGGVQLMLIGDMQQLPPVVKEGEEELLKLHYQTNFFYGSIALQKTKFVCIELKKIYRQKDAKFIDLLNRARDNKIDTESLSMINSRLKQNIQDSDGIILTTHNKTANDINNVRLNAITGDEYTFDAEIKGIFNESNYPVDCHITLKIGAKVMFCKNDTDNHEFFNGKIGVVDKIEDNHIYVKCPDDNSYIDVPKMRWENEKYTLNTRTNEIKTEVIGVFTQFPIRLAWAITIHKSQGLTFDKAVIDGAKAFAHGQIYVALSRCRSLEGITLMSPIPYSAFITNSEIARFNKTVAENEPDQEYLRKAISEYKKKTLIELFNTDFITEFFRDCTKIFLINEGAFPQEYINKIKSVRNSFNNDIASISQQNIDFITKNFDSNINADLVPTFHTDINVSASLLYNRLKNIIEPITHINLNLDNKDVKDRMSKLNLSLARHLYEKSAMLAAYCKTSDIPSIIQAKNNAIISFDKSSVTQNESVGNELYDKLIEWRDQKANELSRLPYYIIPNKKLLEISERKPHDSSELKSIISTQKTKLFGLEILSIIHSIYPSKELLF